MAEDFTHQFLDQAFSVGQQVQLQNWQLFSEIRVLDFFHILTPYHIQKQLKWHSRKFWTSLRVSKLGDYELKHSHSSRFSSLLLVQAKNNLFYVYFLINCHLRQLLLKCFCLVWGIIVCLQVWVGRGSALYVIYFHLHAKGCATLRFRIIYKFTNVPHKCSFI